MSASSDSMRVLVTGGKGFIGKVVCRKLAERGITPVTYDLPDFNIEFRASLKEAVRECDGAIHLAGILGTSETLDRTIEAVRINTEGALNFILAVKAKPMPAVMISVGHHWMLNPYAITKKAAENFAFMANAEYGTKIAVVRAYHAYGPGQKAKPIRKIIPSFVTRALRGQPIQIFGDGSQVIDLIHVEDVAEALVRALVMDHGVYGETLEAGTSVPWTVDAAAEAVRKLLGAPPTEYLAHRAGEQAGAVLADFNLEALGLNPLAMRQFEAELPGVVEWYREHLEEM